MDRTGEGVVRVALQVHLLADALVRPRPVEHNGEAVARRRLALRDAAVAERGPAPEAGAEVGVPEDAAAVLRLQRLRQALHACKIEKKNPIKFPFIQLIQNYYESLATVRMRSCSLNLGSNKQMLCFAVETACVFLTSSDNRSLTTRNNPTKG
jgi:hypothetical protein